MSHAKTRMATTVTAASGTKKTIPTTPCPVEVQYDNGTLLSYTLNAFLPYEGQRISFNGEKGRLDVRMYTRQPWEVEAKADFRQAMSFQKDSKAWQIQADQGEHGGADAKLKELLFKPGAKDPLKKLAGSRAGRHGESHRYCSRTINRIWQANQNRRPDGSLWNQAKLAFLLKRLVVIFALNYYERIGRQRSLADPFYVTMDPFYLNNHGPYHFSYADSSCKDCRVARLCVGLGGRSSGTRCENLPSPK